jgi:hypothetical protein
LLREYAPRIGLEPTFTIHDREDSADLMNLVRHDLGLSAKESRFPTKATCLAIYSRAVNRAGTGGGAGAIIPVVLRLGRRVARNRSIRSAPQPWRDRRSSAAPSTIVNQNGAAKNRSVSHCGSLTSPPPGSDPRDPPGRAGGCNVEFAKFEGVKDPAKAAKKK